MPRQISTLEASVVERALLVGAASPVAPEIFASIHALQVTANCKCGCATLWFGPEGDAVNGKLLADAHGTSGDQDVQVMVWLKDGAIVGLELVGPGSPSLPAAESVRSWAEA